MKRSRINPVSKKPHRRARRSVPVAILLAVKERSGGQCECLIMPDGTPHAPTAAAELLMYPRCNKPAMRQPHHKKKRSRGGKHDAANLLDICFDDHVWTETHDRQAIERGLSELAGRIE